MTVLAWRTAAADALGERGNPDAKTDASLFLCSVLAIGPSALHFFNDRELSAQQEKQLSSMLVRRLAGEPEQYIEGCAYFMGMRFRVDRRVLIPRQDTETLCEAALNELKGLKSPGVLDMCTGSGCLAVAVAKYRPDAQVTACDISKDALDVARENARENGADVEFLQSDGFRALGSRSFSLIVCNPPYLSSEDMLSLQREVGCEPREALIGGEDGLLFYRRFSAEMQPFLAPGGAALFELGAGQAEAVRHIFASALPKAGIDTLEDLNRIERVLRVRL